MKKTKQSKESGGAKKMRRAAVSDSVVRQGSHNDI